MIAIEHQNGTEAVADKAVKLTLPVARWNISLTTTTELLGGKPMSAQLYTSHVAAKYLANGDAAAAARVAEELEMLDENPAAKGMTGFLRDDSGRPFIEDYMVKGFLKEAWRALRQNPASESAKLTAGKSKIDDLLFVTPRLIPLMGWSKEAESIFERPLRADTAQGPRVALTASECLPPGIKCRFDIEVLAPKVINSYLVEEWFAYGTRLGLCQWRSGGYGRFEALVKRFE